MASTAPHPRQLGFVPGLDGLRGIAVLMVMVSHVNLVIPREDVTGIPLIDDLMTGGYLGVDIFFVLSGFLITALLLTGIARTGKPHFGSFYARRALRLLPALYLMLIVHAVYVLLAGLDWDNELKSIQAAVFYYSNWLVVWDLLAISPGTNHLWSLAVEEQFYLVWPVILVYLLGPRRPIGTVVVALTGAIAVIAAHRWMLWEDGTNWVVLLVRTDTRADGLLIGALLACIWVRGLTPIRGADVAGWLALVGLVVYMAVVGPSDAFGFKGGMTLFAAGVAVVILAILNGAWAASRFFALTPLQAIGRVSYGLYLWHFPVDHAVARYGDDLPEVPRLFLALLLTTMFTLFSSFLLERPLSHLRHRIRGQPSPTEAEVSRCTPDRQRSASTRVQGNTCVDVRTGNRRPTKRWKPRPVQWFRCSGSLPKARTFLRRTRFASRNHGSHGTLSRSARGSRPSSASSMRSGWG